MIVDDLDVGRLSIDEEPLFIRFESEPFVVVAAKHYTPAIRVLVLKTKQRFFLLLGAMSLCSQLESIRDANGGRLLGVEIWIYKDGPDKMSKYVIEQ